MELFIWIYISLTVFVNVSHTSTTLSTSTTDRTDGVTSFELSSPEVTSTATTAESPMSATTTAMSTQNHSVTASGDVSTFYTSPELATNKTDSTGNASTSEVYLSASSTTTQEATQPPATTTALNTQTPLITVPVEVSTFYTSTALPTNKTDSTGNASTSDVYLSASSTTTQEATQPPATTTALNTQTPLITVPGEDQEVKSHVVRIVIAVVITVIGTTSLMVVILILYKRRCKKRAAREDSKPELATVKPFATYESFRESNISYAATDILQYNSTPSAEVDASNCDKENDETTVKYSKPVKKPKNRRQESEDRNKYGGHEYEMKDVHMKFPDILSNYDNLPATEGKTSNGKYYQVTNQSKSVLTSTENENSQCKSKKNNLVGDDDSDYKMTRTGDESHGPGDDDSDYKMTRTVEEAHGAGDDDSDYKITRTGKESHGAGDDDSDYKITRTGEESHGAGDDDSDYKTTRTGEEAHGAGDYSYVNPDVGLSKEKLSNLDDEDSYNHTGSDTNKTVIRDEKATCGGSSSGKCVEAADNMNIASDNVETETLAMKYD